MILELGGASSFGHKKQNRVVNGYCPHLFFLSFSFFLPFIFNANNKGDWITLLILLESAALIL